MKGYDDNRRELDVGMDFVHYRNKELQTGHSGHTKANGKGPKTYRIARSGKAETRRGREVAKRI